MSAAAQPRQESIAPSQSAADGLATRRANLRNAESNIASASEPLWEPQVSSGPPTSSELLHPVLSQLDPVFEASLLAILTVPVSTIDGHQRGNDRREQELVALLSTLNPVQSIGLGRRLDIARSDDPIVQAFGRLVVQRRQRLRAFIAGAHRRSFIASHARFRK